MVMSWHTHAGSKNFFLEYDDSVKQKFQSNKNFNFMSLYKATNKVTTQNFNFYGVW